LEGDLHPGLNMADTVTTITPGANVFPFRLDVPLSYFTGKSAAVPFGQAVFDTAFEGPTIGLGDTGTLAIDLNLPPNYCCMLRSLHLSALDTASVFWENGLFGMAYQLPGGPYKNTTAALPESNYLWWPMSASIDRGVRNRSSVVMHNKTWSMTEITTTVDSGASAGPGIDNPMNVPLWISPGYSGPSAVVYVESDQANSSAVDFRFNCVFDLYTQEQAFAAEVMASPRRLAT